MNELHGQANFHVRCINSAGVCGDEDCVACVELLLDGWVALTKCKELLPVLSPIAFLIFEAFASKQVKDALEDDSEEESESELAVRDRVLMAVGQVSQAALRPCLTLIHEALATACQQLQHIGSVETLEQLHCVLLLLGHSLVSVQEQDSGRCLYHIPAAAATEVCVVGQSLDLVFQFAAYMTTVLQDAGLKDSRASPRLTEMLLWVLLVLGQSYLTASEKECKHYVELLARCHHSCQSGRMYALCAAQFALCAMFTWRTEPDVQRAAGKVLVCLVRGCGHQVSSSEMWRCVAAKCVDGDSSFTSLTLDSQSQLVMLVCMSCSNQHEAASLLQTLQHLAHSAFNMQTSGAVDTGRLERVLCMLCGTAQGLPVTDALPDVFRATLPQLDKAIARHYHSTGVVLQALALITYVVSRFMGSLKVQDVSLVLQCCCSVLRSYTQCNRTQKVLSSGLVHLSKHEELFSLLTVIDTIRNNSLFFEATEATLATNAIWDGMASASQLLTKDLLGISELRKLYFGIVHSMLLVLSPAPMYSHTLCSVLCYLRWILSERLHCQSQHKLHWWRRWNPPYKATIPQNTLTRLVPLSQWQTRAMHSLMFCP